MTTTDFTVLEPVDAEPTLQSLLDQAVESAPAPSGKDRAAQIAAAITDRDVEELFALQSKLIGVIDQIVANGIDPDDLGTRTEEQLRGLMVELLDQKDVKRLIEVRYQMIRAAIFAHITEENRTKNIPNPERAPGEAAVPVLGKKFTREGGKLKASLNSDKLREALGEARWAEVTTAVVVPAVAEHIKQELDEDKILELVRRDPSVLELFRSCVTADRYTPQSFHVRELR